MDCAPLRVVPFAAKYRLAIVMMGRMQDLCHMPPAMQKSTESADRASIYDPKNRESDVLIRPHVEPGRQNLSDDLKVVFIGLPGGSTKLDAFQAVN
jgi:hypothetical protein